MRRSSYGVGPTSPLQRCSTISVEQPNTHDTAVLRPVEGAISGTNRHQPDLRHHRKRAAADPPWAAACGRAEGTHKVRENALDMSLPDHHQTCKRLPRDGTGTTPPELKRSLQKSSPERERKGETIFCRAEISQIAKKIHIISRLPSFSLLHASIPPGYPARSCFRTPNKTISKNINTTPPRKPRGRSPQSPPVSNAIGHVRAQPPPPPPPCPDRAVTPTPLPLPPSAFELEMRILGLLTWSITALADRSR